MTQIAADWAGFTDAALDANLTDPTGTIDVSATTFGEALAEILLSVATAPSIDAAAFASCVANRFLLQTCWQLTMLVRAMCCKV